MALARGRRGMPVRVSMVGTCILHFTSSMGVRRREVNAPEAAPQAMRAERGRGSEVGRRVAWTASWARRYCDVMFG